MLPNGKRKFIYFTKEQSKMDIVNSVLLPPWVGYCLQHWMDQNANGRYSAEERVKRFLDDIAYLLLRDNPEGTLSNYKLISRGSTEINVSSCPASIEDEIFGNGAALNESNDLSAFYILVEELDHRAKTYRNQKPRRTKKRPPTKFEKLEAVRRELPGCRIETHAVDTENIFEHGGMEYRISDDVVQDQLRRTKEGILFDMDRVMVVETGNGTLRFYGEAFDRIANEHVAADS